MHSFRCQVGLFGLAWLRCLRCQAGLVGCFGLVWLILAGPSLAADVGPDEEVLLQSASVEVAISTRGGLPVRWLSCAGSCNDPDVPRQVLVAPDDGAIRWQADDAATADAMASTLYTATVHETPEALVAELRPVEEAGAPSRVQRYELSRHSHVLRMILQLPPGTGLQLTSGARFVPPQLPGFGAAFSTVDAVRVDADGQHGIGPEESGVVAGLTASRAAWTGLRSRFWAWLAQPATELPLLLRTPAPNRHELVWRAPDGQLDLTVYAGPVEWKSLRVVSAELTGTLFAALWEPLRWLCLGLLFLLGATSSRVGSEGLAIVLLSLAVKLILYPLTHIADRWQAEVNRAQSRLQPRLAEIRRRFRGEEAHKRTLQAYREEGVHPLYTFKSLAGFAIQVPMFIAAFDMLAGNFALDGVGFLWIADLAAPDRLAQLPFTLPFFGSDLNLLPFLMTAVSILAAVIQQEASLNAELQARQRRNLYLMALAFFLLFYTFPAGMVLYWTANNVWHLIKVLLMRRFA